MIATEIEKLVFLSFNTYVLALDAATGQQAWKWDAPEYSDAKISQRDVKDG